MSYNVLIYLFNKNVNEKVKYSTCRERGTKEKSESPTGIERPVYGRS